MGKAGNSRRKRRYAREPEDVQEHAPPPDKVEGVADDPPAAKHRVTVMGDHKLEFPELYLSVYIAGDPYEQAAFADIFTRASCHKVAHWENADLVVFTGGPDVDPAYYGAKKHPTTKVCDRRDEEDVLLYMQCVAEGVPMLGICRGAQLLHVMNGGALYQHVDGHEGDHHMWDRCDKDIVERISSVHHQMVINNSDKGMHIIGTSGGSKLRWRDDKLFDNGPDQDIEAFFYRETLCLGIQGHPEYRGYNYFAYWAMKKIKDFILETPDTAWDACSRLRLRPELIEQRNIGLGLPADTGIVIEMATGKEIK